MPGDEDGAVADQLAGQRHRLIGFAEVVADDQLDPLAEDAAPGVEILDRHLGGTLVLLAEPSVGAGHRAGDGDPDLGLAARAHEAPRSRSRRRERSPTDHLDLQLVAITCAPR